MRKQLPAEPRPHAAHLVRMRRHRVWRQIAVFLLGAAAVVMISMTNRDWKSVEECRTNMQAIVDALEQSLQRDRILPAQMPTPNEAVRRDRAHYVYNNFYAAALRDRGQAAVCYCDAQHRLYLRENGRHVALFDGEHVHMTWLSENEFRARAEELGISLAP